MKIPKLLRRRRVTVVLGTVNIGRGVTVARARHAFLIVLRTVLHVLRGRKVRPGVMLGLQEVDEADKPDEHGQLHHIADVLAPLIRWAGWATAVPMTVPPGWRILEEHHPTASPGLAEVSPTRPVVIALLEHVATGIRVWRFNGHLAHAPHDPELHAAGARLNVEGNESWAELVDQRLDDGYPILTSRDPNGAHGRLSDPKLADEQVLGTGLDELRVIVPHTYAGKVRVGRRPITVNPRVDGHRLEARVVTITAPKETR